MENQNFPTPTLKIKRQNSICSFVISWKVMHAKLFVIFAIKETFAQINQISFQKLRYLFWKSLLWNLDFPSCHFKCLSRIINNTYKHLLIILTIDKLCWFSLLMYVDYISINSVSGFGWSWGILLDTIWQLCCHGTIVRSWAVFEQFCINNQTAICYPNKTKENCLMFWHSDMVNWQTTDICFPILKFPPNPPHF